jgi:SAM-dependent methyltransferase
MIKLEKHLGGHFNITHLDSGALEWAIENYQVKSMLDIGCGPGGMVELAVKKYGLDALGIDGDFTLERFDDSKFLIHDYTKGHAEINKDFDLAWSCEFVEHVYEEFLPNYMPSFQSCKVVIMTYAPPGHGGYHHVNCRPEEYWIEKFKNYGFSYDENLTKELRIASTMNIEKPKAKQFVKNRGMVFLNEKFI